MSEFRVDPISGEYTIIASERANRPYDFNENNEFSESGKCPFCPGNEEMTPKAIIENKDFETDTNWSIRVIPNIYPIVSNNISDIDTDKFYKSQNGYGFHDVLIDTPNHTETIIDFSKHHTENVFFTLQKRQIDIEKNSDIKYVHIFKNQGKRAGASKMHSHWQIVGLTIIPEKQNKLLYGNELYIKNKGICGYCDIIKHEIEYKQRLIAENDKFVAIAPYASKFPYEVWILPKIHCESFSKFDNIHIKKLSELFQKMIKSLNLLFPNMNFNVCFEGSPNGLNNINLHHWHLQIIPHLSSLAGFELGTLCHINIYPPELVAKNLRENTM